MRQQKRLIKVFSVFLFFVLLITSCQTKPVDKQKNTFRVGMECGYAPFNWTQLDDSNGAVPIDGAPNQFANGYDVQIAKKLADAMGKELEVVKVSWSGLIPALQIGKIDAVLAGMSATEERKKTIDFTEHYYSSDLVVVVRKDGAFVNATSLSDLSGAKITGQQGTLHYDVIDQIPNVQKETAKEDFPTMIIALKSGIIDGYISERPGALGAVSANPDLVFVDFAGGDTFSYDESEVTIAVGLVKGSVLREELNTILETIPEADREKIMKEAVLNQASEVAVDEGEDEAPKSFFQRIGDIVGKYYMHFLRGAGVTLLIALTATIVGLIIGFLVATIKEIPASQSNFFVKILDVILSIYVEVFRGTPMMVQATVFYYGIIGVFKLTNFSPMLAGFIIVSINTGAYMAEVVRGGIESIDHGQLEAAKAIGMTHGQIMFYIILPQAFRNVLPATGNEFVINIKDTSVLNVISVTELYFAAKDVQGLTNMMFETYLIIAVIYLVLTFTITRILHYVERRMDGPKNFTLTSSTTPATVKLHQKQRKETAYGKR